MIRSESRCRRSGRAGRRGLLLVCALLPFLPSFLAAQSPGPRPAIAVVVHPDSPVTDISVEELRSLYLGRPIDRPGIDSVVLYEHVPVRDAFYRSVVGWDEFRARQHWIGLIFDGLAPAPPVGEESAQSLLRRVSTDLQAIAFIDSDSVDRSVRTLTVDGFEPDAPAYPIR